MIKKNIIKSQRSLNCIITQKNLNLTSVIKQAKKALSQEVNVLNKTQSNQRLLGRLSKMPNLDPIKQYNKLEFKQNKQLEFKQNKPLVFEAKATKYKQDKISGYKDSKTINQEQCYEKYSTKQVNKNDQLKESQGQDIQALEYCEQQERYQKMLKQAIDQQLCNGVKISMKYIEDE